MVSRQIDLARLGWNEWFEEREKCGHADTIARVAAVARDQLLLVGEHGFFRAKLSGKYLHESEGSMQRPCVGDWVCVAKSAQDLFGIVQGVLERQTELRRKAAGDTVEFQMIGGLPGTLFIS